MNVTHAFPGFAESAARTGSEPHGVPGLGTLQGGFGPVSGELGGTGGQSVSVESLSFADPAGAEWCMCISALLDTRTAA